MPFMERQIEFGRWIVVDGPAGGEVIPAWFANEVQEYINPCHAVYDGDAFRYEYEKNAIPVPAELRDYLENDTVWEIRVVEGWGSRLSAPGYLDCTSWTLYDTEQEALDAAAEEDEDESE